MNLYNRSKRKKLGTVRRAAGFLARLTGLLFRNPARHPEALWIVPCGAVHTVGMREPLDIFFLAKDLKILKIARGVKPFSLCVYSSGASSVLEFFPGTWDPSAAEAGDQLEIE